MTQPYNAVENGQRSYTLAIAQQRIALLERQLDEANAMLKDTRWALRTLSMRFNRYAQAFDDVCVEHGLNRDDYLDPPAVAETEGNTE